MAKADYSKVSDRFKKEFGKRLKRALELNGKGARQSLVEQLEINDNTISYWLNGTRAPKVDQIPIICKTLDISANELLGMKNFEPENNNDLLMAISDYTGLSVDTINQLHTEKEKKTDYSLLLLELVDNLVKGFTNGSLMPYIRTLSKQTGLIKWQQIQAIKRLEIAQNLANESSTLEEYRKKVKSAIEKGYKETKNNPFSPFVDNGKPVSENVFINVSGIFDIYELDVFMQEVAIKRITDVMADSLKNTFGYNGFDTVNKRFAEMYRKLETTVSNLESPTAN